MPTLPACTPAVTRAVQAAQDWAHALSAAEVQPVHLLYALLDEPEGQAAVLLVRAGLDLASLRPPVACARSGSPPAPLPWHAAAERVLEEARQAAVNLAADRTVSGEHLVWGLLLGDAGLRARLEALGLDWPRLEAGLRAGEAPLPMEEPLQLSAPPEQIDTARILDAAANRAREALRVLEDYCRFALDDAFLSRELKRLRHGLAEALADFAPHMLLEARETEQDVGTVIRTDREQRRHSLLDVVRANAKRLQEALRSLEEYGKLRGPDLGRVVERLRYASYTLERVILLGADARRRLEHARLYVLLTGSRCAATLDWTIEEAAAGGAAVFQLREKGLADRDLLERARQVRRWTRQAGALFIVNDRPDIARLAEADGVHLGQDDLPVKEARRVLGADALIGVSTHDLDQLRRAILDGATYVGVGPTFPSGTKDFAELAGLEYVRQAAAETSLPAFVLGGINADTVAAAVAAGARRVAVSQAVCQAEEPRQAAATLLRALPPPSQPTEHP